MQIGPLTYRMHLYVKQKQTISLTIYKCGSEWIQIIPGIEWITATVHVQYIAPYNKRKFA